MSHSKVKNQVISLIGDYFWMIVGAALGLFIVFKLLPQAYSTQDRIDRATVSDHKVFIADHTDQSN